MSVKAEIGELAARFIDSIEDQYGEGAKVCVGGIIVAVDHGDEKNITYHQTWAPSSAAVHEAVGLLELALRARYTDLADPE